MKITVDTRWLARFGASLVAAIALVGCGTGTSNEQADVDQELGSDVVAREIAHSMEQEAIRTCMAEQGFDYTATTFSPTRAALSFENQFFLDQNNVTSIGYGALFGAMTITFAELGAPPRPDSGAMAEWTGVDHQQYQSMLAAYTEALIGSDSAAEPSRGGSSDGPRPGCRKVGSSAIEGLKIRDPRPDWHSHERSFSLREQMESTEQYAKFSAAWTTCIKTRGYDITSPEDHAVFGTMFLDFKSKINRIEMRDSAEFAPIRAAARPGPDGLTEDWFLSSIGLHPAFESMYRTELAQAEADQACRQLHEGDLRSTLRSLEAELVDSP